MGYPRLRSCVLTRTLLSVLLVAGSVPAADFHVTASAAAGGTGSLAAPWTLAAALAAPAAVHPGDTIWIHAGTYRGSFTSALAGASGVPIVVRAAPGERATIDGDGPNGANAFIINGSWTWYWDLEFTNSRSTTRFVASGRPECVTVYAPNTKVIDCIVHDGGQGIGFWQGAIDSEIYGCVISNNGTDWTDRAHGHGIYTQNATGTGTKRIRDNIICNGYSFGIHGYGQAGQVDGYEIAGNALFNNGVSAVGPGELKDNLLLGCYPGVGHCDVHDNFGWSDSASTRDFSFGRYAQSGNRGIALRNNFIYGTTDFSNTWQSVTLQGNTFFGAVSGLASATAPGNTYLTSAPTAPTVFIRPNAYHPGRAHVVVYNWSQAATVAVDLSAVLGAGATYEVRNAQDYYAAPVAAGSYAGGTVALPMAVTIAQPIGSPGAIQVQESTGLRFNVFVVLPMAAGAGTGTTGGAATGTGTTTGSGTTGSTTGSGSSDSGGGGHGCGTGAALASLGALIGAAGARRPHFRGSARA
jgi:hypothetical protein